MRTLVMVLAALLSAGPTAPASAARGVVSPVLAGCVDVTSIGLFPPDGGLPRRVVPPYSYWPDVSPDGKRLAYVGSVDRFSAVFIKDLTTGLVRQVSYEAHFFKPEWAPDGRRLAVSGDSLPVSVIDTAEAQPQVRLVPGAAGHTPSWSPDGQLLVYVGKTGLVVVHADGRNPTPLGVEGQLPQWSPDGREILYAADGELRAVSLPGLTQRLVLRRGDTRTHYTWPAWSPDGRWVYAQQWTGDLSRGTTSRIIRTRAHGKPSIGPDPSFYTPAGSGCPSLGGPSGRARLGPRPRTVFGPVLRVQ